MKPEVLRPEEVSRQIGLEQAIDRYKQSNFFLSLSKNTRLSYNGDLTRFQEYCNARNILSASQLAPEDVTNLRDQLKQSGYSDATINRRVSSLSSFLGWARIEGLSKTNLTDAFIIHRPEKGRPRTLTAEQVETLILSAKSPRDSALILIALTTGATTTEIVNLNAEDILRTGDGNTAIRFKGIVKKTQPRTLKTDKRAGSKITEYIEDSKLESGDPLFRGRHEYGRLTRSGVWLILRNYGPEIGVENLSPHMLRDTFIANFTGTQHQLVEVLGRKT